MVSAAPRHTLSVTVPITLASQPALRLDHGTLSLAVPANADSSDESIQSLFNSGTARLVLDDAYLQLDAATALQNASDEIAPLIDAVQGLKFELLTLHRSTLVVTFGDGHSETLNDINAEVSQKRKGVLAAKGTFTVRGLTQSFDVTLGRRSERKIPAQIPLKFHVTSPEFEFAFDGLLDGENGLFLAGHADMAIADVRQAARWLGASWPRGPGLLELRARGQLGWTGRALAFDRATFQIDGNQATGALAVNAANVSPLLSGTLAFKALDLTRYTRGTQDEEATRRLSWASLTGNESPMPLAELVDADVRVSAARVQLEGLALGRSAATLTLKNGKMLADIVEFEFHDGQGNGQIALDTLGPKPKLSVAAKLQDVDLGRASSSLLGATVLQGRGDIVTNLSANGATGPDLLKTLSGKLGVAIKEGGRLGIDAKALLAAAQRRDADALKSAMRGQTPVEQFDVRLNFLNGVAVSEHLQAVSADMKFFGHGSLSLPDDRIDLRLDAMPNSGAAARSQTLRFNGRLSAPEISYDGMPGGEAAPAGDGAPPMDTPARNPG